MLQHHFTAEGWESWGLEQRPLIPEGMPVLIDDDLMFEDERGPRPAVAVNRWLRELPTKGVPAPNSWDSYARAVRAWMEHLSGYGVGLFDERARLKAALSSYVVVRSHGPLEMRFEATTWNQHMSILSAFYKWATDEEYASAVPFTYTQAMSQFGEQLTTMAVNNARRRTPKAHVTVKYLEEDFAELFLRGLGGLDAQGAPDEAFHGRELTRNAAIGRMVLATGLRRQEFTHLLAVEVPALPPAPRAIPIPFPVPAGVTKGSKFRTTWINYDALAEVHRYISMVRPLSAQGSRWLPPARWGEPLHVSEIDPIGGRIGGRRVRWAELRPAERRRLVAPDGGSMLLAVKAGGGPFTAWPTVFARTGDRLRERFEPRFPHIFAHRLRHTFAIRELEMLVKGYYAQAAKLVRDTDADAALALYLAKADPMMVLRDLLGHSSVLTTEMYLRQGSGIASDGCERAGRLVEAAA